MDYETASVFSRSWGLLFLVALFLGGVAYALWPRNGERFRQASMIPLQDDVDEERRKSDG